MHLHVHCSIIYKREGMEATQAFTNGQTDKENVTYACYCCLVAKSYLTFLRLRGL